MRIHCLCLLIALLSFSAYGTPPEPESFDLSISVVDLDNHDSTMVATVYVGLPFAFTATSGAITNKVSGALHAPIDGAYMLDLDRADWESEKQKSGETTQLRLVPGKAWGGDDFNFPASFKTRTVVLRRHEPASKAP